MSYALMDKVLDQIKKDIEDGDFTAIAEMIATHVPTEAMRAYLPEETTIQEDVK